MEPVYKEEVKRGFNDGRLDPGESRSRNGFQRDPVLDERKGKLLNYKAAPVCMLGYPDETIKNIYNFITYNVKTKVVQLRSDCKFEINLERKISIVE